MTRANYGLYGSPGFFMLFILIALAALGIAVVFESLRAVFILLSLLAVVLPFAVPLLLVRIRRGVIPRIVATGHIGQGSRVLDVGTGRGFPAVEIAKAVPGCRVTGIDLWEQPAEGEMHKGFLLGNTRENAERNAEIEGVKDRVDFMQADARRMPFETGTFDAVVSFTAIHQMSSLGMAGEQVLGEIHRVLKPGGRFVDVDLLIGRRFTEVMQGLGFREITLSDIRLLGVLKILAATKE